MKSGLMIAVALLGTVLSTSAASGQNPAMRVEGACPGSLNIEVRGATPNGIIAILIGFQTGSTRIPSGACQGTMLGLDSRGLRVATIQRADREGTLALMPRVGPAACGKYLQAIDGRTCGTTNVVQIN